MTGFMKALVLTSGGLVAAKTLSAWLSTGNSVAALWVGSKDPQRILQRDVTLGIAAPSWSISALARHHKFPVQQNPKLSTWTEVATAIQYLGADVLITAMTHQIVPENILALFSGRAVNFHPAILPYYRGPNPRAGMILDGKADRYGGITLHCLSRGIDEGDIIGIRKVPYDASRGFIHWDVCLARAAGDLVQNDLQSYLKGTLRPQAQNTEEGSYRKVSENEKTLSAEHSASRTKWLCDHLAAPGWVSFRSHSGKKYVVSHFIRRVGPRLFDSEKVGRITIEFDAADARVSILRRGTWTLLWQTVMYWVVIARTHRTQ